MKSEQVPCAIKFLIVLFVWGLFFPCAADIDQDIRLAQAFYETSEYRRARQIYEELLKDNKSSWQRNELLYNIATVLMAEGKFDEALTQYNEISTEADLSPLLNKRLQQNIAWIHLLQAMNQAAMVNENPNATVEDYRKGIFLFREALDSIQDAQKAACKLALLKGYDSCELDLVLKEMGETAKVQFTLFLQKFEDYQLVHVGVRDGIPLLFSIVNNAQNDLNVLQNKNLSEKMKEHYLQYYLQLENRRLFYWNLLKEKIEQDPAHAEERKDFFEAEEFFLQFIQQMKQGDFEQAQQALNQTIESLNTLMRVIFGNEPLPVILRKLLASYTIALLQEPLQQSALLSLQNEQTQFKSFLSSENFSPVEKNLSLAVKALDQAKTNDARLFAEEAQHLIKQMVRRHEITQKEVPATILEQGIEDQEWALMMNRLGQQINENLSSEASEIVARSQTSVFQTVQQFTEVVIKYQQNEFQNASDPQLRCQDSPWDEVIPLFDQGYQDAKQAQDLLTKDYLRTAASLQEKVLKSWREALRLMREPKKKRKEKPEKTAEEPAAPKEEPSQQPKEELNQTLRLLQEMEHDDQSQPKLDVIPNKQELKPW